MRPDALEAAIAADRAAGPPADRGRRHGRHHVVHLGRPGRGDRRHRRPRGSLAPRRRRLRGGGRDRSRAARPVPRLGARRLDRRQPAQVALDAGRRVAAPEPPAGRRPRRVQPRPGVPPHRRLDRRRHRAQLQRVHAPARPPVPGAEAVDPAPLVRPRRAPPADPPPPRAGAGVRRLGRRRAGLGAARARAVLDGLLPPRAAALDRRRRRRASTPTTPR